MTQSPVVSDTRHQRRRDSRRAALVRAALAVFAEKGVTAASVDDIVAAAGVAKGTFYLYFRTKDEAVNAVAEQMVEGVADRMDAIAATSGRTPVERLVALTAALEEVGADEHERELIEIFHRPANRLVHDRMGERAIEQVRPAVVRIISEGIEAGMFRRQDPRHAADFVLATLGSLHNIVVSPADAAQAIKELDDFILRGLGYERGIEG